MARSSLQAYVDLLLRGVRSARLRRARRQAALQLDSLEGRVVLSQMGLQGRMAFPGLAHSAHFRELSHAHHPSTGGTTDTGSDRRGPGGVQDAQLATDLQQLRTDTQAVLSGSTVSDTQRQALASSMRALRDAGATFDRTKLGAVADGVLTALASGSDATKADFAAALTSSKPIDPNLIDTAYNNLVTVARGLNLSTDELNTLASDRAAIKADFDRLSAGDTGQNGGHHGPGDSSNLELILGHGPGDQGHGPGDHGGPGRGPGGPGRGPGRGGF